MFEKINEVIKKDISPVLIAHGGDMEVIHFNNGILKVRLLGQCANCAYSYSTLDEVISEKLKEKIPEIKEVVLDDGVSLDMLQKVKSFIKSLQS